MAKKQFILDGSGFKTLEGFFDQAGKVLCPDFKWGRNLDAFNDILFGGFGAFEVEEPIDLIWKHAAKSKEDLGYDETIRQVKKWLRQCHPANRASLREDLKKAEEGKGKTIFEMLIEIIKENRHIHFTIEE